MEQSDWSARKNGIAKSGKHLFHEQRGAKFVEFAAVSRLVHSQLHGHCNADSVKEMDEKNVVSCSVLDTTTA